MMSSTSDDQIAEVIRRYVSLLATGSTDDLLELFAEDATVEDPVGSDVRAGRNEIREFFSTLQQLERQTELVLLRVAGNEAAFSFTITFKAGDTPMRLQPIDTMTFDRDGKITSVRSYFAPADLAEV
ncbi:nuclear transport factor 2 family protein [Mycolicibacterium fortuitum]|uniref:Nuclear transport factor 2 family protein n=3 Tax=Mycolicibacterium fortuitum TaxID=1766 RepID=A0AAE4VEW5_MYCFO|nr:nuclear transport factor 2 family protein [Mycolicibacterium fortuitum]GAT03923.1 steroid delta-isomerase [Mycolicibacterium fortuitum subsp. acetamidolyticum]MCA4754426.1 nuclear transport factor 2 family protein [Mycolicibacterium fortuitum]MCV7142651.1 nuclear transport factor 2 family protein [Mycolicibacterium fortuitum]MDV7260553.1 nuclear transport factor 2 family protein [Mycolicibacterium fortuitum]MDV7285436.1 nuclear transport factor 2 family protein [Mycolicibacterium fortuitum]